MIKLSRRNWNNVLIFAVLALMFVLYGMPQRGQQQSVAQARLIPADASLLMVSFGSLRLIQAGQQWQLQPLSARSADAEKMALAWQHSELEPAVGAQVQTKVPVAQASVQLAGQFKPILWLLYPDAQGYLLQQAGQPTLYQLTAEQAAQLFIFP